MLLSCLWFGPSVASTSYLLLRCSGRDSSPGARKGTYPGTCEVHCKKGSSARGDGKGKCGAAGWRMCDAGVLSWRRGSWGQGRSVEEEG